MIENYFFSSEDSKFTSLVSIAVNFIGSTLKPMLEASNRDNGGSVFFTCTLAQTCGTISINQESGYQFPGFSNLENFTPESCSSR